MNKLSRLTCSGVFVALAVTGYGYNDALVAHSDATAIRKVTPTHVAYVFTNAAEQVTVTPQSNVRLVDRLIVAGGGGGGSPIGGGGGGGGVIPDHTAVDLSTGSSLILFVGAGGSGRIGKDKDTDLVCQGGDSSLTIGGITQTAKGGGYGADWDRNGSSGGSGGGQSCGRTSVHAGTSGQGFAGGAGKSADGKCIGPGGGGGAAEPGQASTQGVSGRGGEGLVSAITGVSVVYGSGGGGGANGSSYKSGAGGTNAGDGGQNASGKGTGGAGVDGTGGGGGGQANVGSATGGRGGCGTVVLAFAPTASSGCGIFSVRTSHPCPDGVLTPAAGAQLLATGATVECSAKPVSTNSETEVVSTITGYTLETYDVLTGTWSDPVAHSGASYSHVQNGADIVRLTWLVENELPSVGYADDLMETTDATVGHPVAGSGVSYVFTDPSGLKLVRFKQDVVVARRLVVAGGGSGGCPIGGGGGGGGVLAVEDDLSVASGELVSLSVGAGGQSRASGQASEQKAACRGGDSRLEIGETVLEAQGGGYGADYDADGSSGGSGGGGSGSHAGREGVAGQGCAGGSGKGVGGAGGGGASEAGHDYDTTVGGVGGEGVVNDITGTFVVYGSGGGGGYGVSSSVPGAGGTNAGSGGDDASFGSGYPGTDGTGAGGGGQTYRSGAIAGRGGNGTVIFNVYPANGKFAVIEDIPSEYASALIQPAAGGVKTAQDGASLVAEVVTTTNADAVVTCARGYYLETLNRTTGGWSDPEYHEGSSYAVPDGAGVRISWVLEHHVANAKYADGLLETAASGVSGVMTRSGVSYVFTNTEAASSIVFTKPLRLNRRLVVAGGGGGGSPIGGGGGGGGVIAEDQSVDLASGIVGSVQVGAGGIGRNGKDQDKTLCKGRNSVLSLGSSAVQTALGGGYGNDFDGTGVSSGGSGGGGVGNNSAGKGEAGQGHDGGSGVKQPGQTQGGSAGGGGAAEPGHVYLDAVGGVGGEGVTNDITGVSVVYGSGGGGGGGNGRISGKGGTNAGAGGDAARGNKGGYPGVDGTGGGGGGQNHSYGGSGGAGGSGVVVLNVAPETGSLLQIAAPTGVFSCCRSEPAPGFYAGCGEPIFCHALVTTNKSNKVFVPVGYELETFDAGRGTWSAPEVHAGDTYVHPAEGTDAIRLSWIWERKKSGMMIILR